MYLINILKGFITNNIKMELNKNGTNNLDLESKIIVFDTETTGLPTSRIINAETMHLWPHIVQFSYVIYNVSQHVMEKVTNMVVKIPENIIMTEENINIHKITNEMVQNSSHTIQDILNEFIVDINNSQVKAIVGHNISYDINMLKIALLRLIHNKETTETTNYKKMFYELNYTNKTFCTMKSSVNICQISVQKKDGTSYYKFPKLIELYKILFDEVPMNLHNSLIDVLVTLRCYYKIVYNEDLLQLESNAFTLLFNTLISNN
jgi:DNA polymerase III epsilon subunit-like protein